MKTANPLEKEYLGLGKSFHGQNGENNSDDRVAKSIATPRGSARVGSTSDRKIDDLDSNSHGVSSKNNLQNF